jgi:nitroreductase
MSTNPRVADYPSTPSSPHAGRRAPSPAKHPAGNPAELFEAARWAPSAYNSQPWRFLYARRDTPNWERFLGC